MVVLMIHSEQTQQPHLADSFFIFNCSCKIEITVPCDMPMAVSTSSRTRRSVKTILWTLSMQPQLDVPNEVTYGCMTMFKFIHPIIYNHKQLVQICSTLTNSALISSGVKLFICRCLITARISFVSVLQKIQRLFALIIFRNETTR